MQPSRFPHRTGALAAALFLAAIVVPHAQSRKALHPIRSRMPAIHASALRSATHGHTPHRSDIGFRGHGFVGDPSAGPFTTIDAPRAGLYTVVFGIEDDGRTVGAFLDKKGVMHGLLRARDTFTPIDVPGAGATFAARINRRGQIVGGYSRERLMPALELSHGFLFEDGNFTAIDVPGARRTQAFGINNSGQIVGEHVDAHGRTRGFLLSEGIYTTIDAPNSTATFAYDIDDNGRILGFSFDGAAFHGFVRDADGAFTAIDMPGAEQRGTVTLGFNNHGQIVGVGLLLEGDQLTSAAFVLEDGSFNRFEVPDAELVGIAFDISDQGQVAGAYDFAGHGFLRGRNGDFTTIDPPEGNINEVLGINNRGQIVGRYIDAQGRARGFLKDGRRFVPIDAPGAVATSTFQINDRGQIVGNYSATSNNTAYPLRAFVREPDGEFSLIDIPGAQHTNTVGIDNLGRVVGEYQDAAGVFHGFVRDGDGAVTTIDAEAPEATATALTAINDRGQIVGAYVEANGTVHAFLLDHGRFTAIDAPGAVVTVPSAINNRGDIVGLSFDGVRIHAFVRRTGRFSRITPPGACIPWLIGTAASDINERGEIAGASL